MDGRTVWIWVLVSFLVVAAAVASWLATRSPDASKPAAVSEMTADTDVNETVSSANSVPPPASVTAETTVPPVESPPVAAASDTKTADLPPSGSELGTGGKVGTRTQPEQVTIRALFDHRDQYDGRIVIVRGKITTQCPQGCRFNLDDGTGVLFVELVDKALERALPPGSIGKQIEVRGVFHAAPRPALIVDDPGGVVWR